MEVRRKWAAAPAFSVRVDIELSFSIENAKIFVFSCCILVQREKLRKCAKFQKNRLRSVRDLENLSIFQSCGPRCTKCAKLADEFCNESAL